MRCRTQHWPNAPSGHMDGGDLGTCECCSGSHRCTACLTDRCEHSAGSSMFPNSPQEMSNEDLRCPEQNVSTPLFDELSKAFGKMLGH
jgi:hypothetical protein